MFFAFNNVMVRMKNLGCLYSFDQEAVVAVHVDQWRLPKVGKWAAVEQENGRTANWSLVPYLFHGLSCPVCEQHPENSHLAREDEIWKSFKADSAAWEVEKKQVVMW